MTEDSKDLTQDLLIDYSDVDSEKHAIILTTSETGDKNHVFPL